MKAQTDVEDIDFVLPEVWEGPGHELHLNDVTAESTVYGRRILSGITSMILALPPAIEAVGWQWPRKMAWEFIAPVHAREQLIASWSDDEEDARRLSCVVSVDDAVVSRGELQYEADPGFAPRTPADGGTATPGRTLFDGDVDMFNWWTSRFRLPSASSSRSANVPWPLLISLCGGLFTRLPLTESPPDDVVNRAMRWELHKPLRVGDTVRGFLTEEQERPSQTRPGWSIWQGRCDFTLDQDPDTLIATYWPTAMLYRSPVASSA